MDLGYSRWHGALCCARWFDWLKRWFGPIAKRVIHYRQNLMLKIDVFLQQSSILARQTALF
jgi:hypothetical protein